jgi:glycerol kinase
MAYQSRDILEAMSADTGKKLRVLRVDGGATQNDFLMQFQADLMGVSVDRPKIVESTAAGAAYLAGMGVGIWKNGRDVESARRSDRVFKPAMKAAERRRLYEGWAEAVERVRSRRG